MMPNKLIDSGKRAAKYGFIHSLITVAFAVIFNYVIMLLTNGENFVTKNPTQTVINGLRYDVVLAVLAILTGLIQIFLFNTDSGFFLLEYIPVYVICYIGFGFLVLSFPLRGIFDILFYLIGPAPVGVVLGVVLKLIYIYFKKSIRK